MTFASHRAENVVESFEYLHICSSLLKWHKLTYVNIRFFIFHNKNLCICFKRGYRNYVFSILKSFSKIINIEFQTNLNQNNSKFHNKPKSS